jgi:hypothetical protein
MLQEEARPSDSRALDLTSAGPDLAVGMELRCIRLATWRIVYLINETERSVSVLALRRRPPYQYDDIRELLEGV